jgi:hypothetical protein
MLAKLFRMTTFLAVAAAVSYVASGPSSRAWGQEEARKLTPIPANEGGTPAAANNGDRTTATPTNANGAAAYPPGVFNYYVHPGATGLVGAQLYVEPRPTPPLVGHTYVTYPPLMPHEFLYQHHRVYRTYNPGSGWTRTRARWH